MDHTQRRHLSAARAAASAPAAATADIQTWVQQSREARLAHLKVGRLHCAGPCQAVAALEAALASPRLDVDLLIGLGGQSCTLRLCDINTQAMQLFVISPP